ncbi:MAG: ABC transporter permease [Firmicutes bacterium]|nr:ABC transporter permease [Bacillota bacterium]
MRSAYGVKNWLAPGLSLTLLGLLIFFPDLWARLIKLIYPEAAIVAYPGTSLGQLVAEHLLLVLASSLLSISLGVLLGILVTRPSGREYRQAAGDITAMGQTFPPVAVIALAVPLLGFGYPPTLLALFLYGILPVIKNTSAGLEAVSADLIEAATGQGMSRGQLLRRVELPLASRVIMAGIRTSVIVNIGTATIGAAFGAGGLGAPIIAGLVRDNPALILQGAIPAALLAIIADMLLARLELRS